MTCSSPNKNKNKYDVEIDRTQEPFHVRKLGLPP